VKDRFPFPKIQDCVHKLNGSLWYSVVDLSSSFYQIGLDEESRLKTSFLTRMSQWKFTRMAMGQCNAPSSFCWLLSLTLRGLDAGVCLNCVDDVTIMGTSASAHAYNLDLVLSRIRQAGLKSKPKSVNCFVKKNVFWVIESVATK